MKSKILTAVVCVTALFLTGCVNTGYGHHEWRVTSFDGTESTNYTFDRNNFTRSHFNRNTGDVATDSWTQTRGNYQHYKQPRQYYSYPGSNQIWNGEMGYGGYPATTAYR